MSNYSNIMGKSKDIYLLMRVLAKVGWKTVRETSLNRILYLSAVVYSFRYPDDNNIFQNNYRFTVTLSGPEDSDVDSALINLVSNDLLVQVNEGYELSNMPINTAFLMSDERKRCWFDDIIYIIGVYGEDKIYDFIFRDPEYRTSLRSNTIYNLNIGTDNATVKFLNSFKSAFEEKLKDKKDALNNRQYLELDFEYIFGKILRGEK